LTACATRRRPLLAVYAAVAVGAGVAAAATAAQDPAATSPMKLTGALKATPSKTGTLRRPVGIRITGAFKFLTPSDLEPPLVTGIEFLHGPGWTYSGSLYTACTKAILDRRGPAGCPKKSIVGTAVGTGWADTVAARMDATLVNGPKGKLLVYFRLDNPARVRETVLGTSEDFARGPWQHRETWTIPRSLQVVAGIPLRITDMKFDVGGRPSTKMYTASTSCPRSGWTWRVVIHTLVDSTGTTSDSTLDGAMPCRR
jgi:hypothetical protein